MPILAISCHPSPACPRPFDATCPRPSDATIVTAVSCDKVRFPAFFGLSTLTRCGMPRTGLGHGSEGKVRIAEYKLSWHP